MRQIDPDILRVMQGSTREAPTAVERHRWLCNIVDRALDLPPEERTLYLAEVCGRDDLRQEVDRMLALDSRLGDVFDHLDRLAESHPVDQLDDGIDLPEEIGGYRVLKLLGAGGMGLVFLAEQDEPVQRVVAVKVIRTNLDNPYLQARFDAERNALARLSHPCIAQLHDAGRSEEGFPYFAMEYLPSAERLTDYCAARALSRSQRLRLFVQVCQGVQHAHQKGILHLDLKPANIQVVELEGEARPLPKIIDFGLARALDGLPLGSSTEQGTVAGTPGYMSPEALVSTRDVDTRSDVFSLGVVLWELLTGKHPKDLRASNPEKEGQAQRGIRGDLESIVRRATVSGPGDRYASAAELAADVERYLDHLPVIARDGSGLYRAARFVRRHRVSVLAASCVVLALIGGFVARTLEAERTRLALAESEELTGFLVGLFREANPTLRGKTLTVRELVDQGVLDLGSRFEDQPATRARFLSLLGSIYQSLALYDVAEPLLAEARSVQEQLETKREDLGETLVWQGLVDHGAGRFEKARERFERALQICDETVGRQSACAGEALFYLGRATNSLGAIDEAEARLNEAWTLQQEVLRPDDRRLGHTASALGFLALERAEYATAEALFEDARRIYEASFPPDHPQQALIATNLGSLYVQQDRLAEAEAVLRRAVEIQEVTLGAHRRHADTLGNLAVVYRRLERYDEAATVMHRALEIRQELLGSGHPDVAISLNNIGVFYWSQQRYGEAEKQYRQALTIQEEALEPGHFHIGHTASNLGLALWKQGRLDEAEPFLQRGLNIWEDSLGRDHKALAWPLWGLAGVRRDQNRLADAEAFYERLLLLRDTEGAEQPPFNDAVADFAVLLRATGRGDRAEEIQHGRSPDDHSDSAE